MSFSTFGLTPKRSSKAVETQKAIKEKAVTVIREDGKEILISKDQVAAHINRGFTVESKKDEPTIEERANAVGYTKQMDTEMGDGKTDKGIGKRAKSKKKK